MNSKAISSRRSAAVSTRTDSSGFDFLADFSREQLAMVMDASSAMFRGFEAMRGIQQQAAQQASARHEAAARQLRETFAPVDLMAIPLGLLQTDLQNALRYWQDIAANALETQTEIMGCASHLLNTESALESASAVQGLKSIPGVVSLFPRRPRNGLDREPGATS